MTDQDPKTVRDYPETLDDENGSQLVGVTADGEPQYYDPVQNRIAPAFDADGELLPSWEEGRELSPGETLQDAIDDIEERVGWESLTDDD
ncbi:hypothetical protein [Halorarius halobius]|uniref:hypothetical protein n=1 Tax=Halorarius halobius TaxID=2962671 RepID=UPI0020CEEE70|nr:hypothetical protein [Halorarius halobius]